MPDFQNVRPLIESLLSALSGEVTLTDDVTLRCGPCLTATLSRHDGEPARAVLSLDPPPEIHVHRGPLHLRCSLKSVTIGPDDLHASIDGWFDRRWQVKS